MTAALTIPVPDTREAESAGSALVAQARAFSVVTDVDARAAGAFLVQLAAERRARVDAVAPAKKAAYDAHKAMTALEARMVAPLDEARAVVEPRLSAWQRADRERREAEAREAAAEARRAEEDRRLADAQDAADAGHADAAEAILDDVRPVAYQPVAPPTEIEGVATRVTYSAEVKDLLALVRHVAANPDQIALLKPDATALNAMARALKGLLSIPGVNVVRTESLAVRAAN